MTSPEMRPGGEQNSLANKISRRADLASTKIQQRIRDNFMPMLTRLGDDMMGRSYLNNLRNDFYTLVENPNHECGDGNYKGWTAEEIKELYSVLYGEEIE